MPSVKNAITDLSNLKTLALDKASRAESSRTDQQIQRSQINAAEQRIEQAEASVQRYELQKTKAEDKLSPPPTKTVPSDGKKGGSKTVVDEREKDKLQSQVRAAEMQIQQAQAAVEASRGEADEMQNNILLTAGISAEQQSQMADLSSKISELESMSKDEQIDLTGEAFQKKLETAITLTEKLANDLPDSSNAALVDFWEEIGEGFGNIHEKINEQITPTPAEVKSSNNYSGFFEDAEQGFDSILGHLESNGAPIEIIAGMHGAKASVLSGKDVYLGGMNASDDQSLSNFLTHMNTMIGTMRDGELSNEDVADLLSYSEEVAGIVQNGGSDLPDVAQNTLKASATPIDLIKEGLSPDHEKYADFMNMYNRLNDIYQANGAEGYELLRGMSREEGDLLSQFAIETTDIYSEFSKTGLLTNENADYVINTANQIGDILEKYGMSSGIGGDGFDRLNQGGQQQTIPRGASRRNQF